MKDTIRIPLPGSRSFDGNFRPGNGRELTLLLPGLRYGCDRPLLAATAALMAARGGDVGALKFDYQNDSDFLRMADPDQLALIRCDGRAIVEHCLKLSNYRSLNVVGKSLGTISMAGLAEIKMPTRTRLIWLTPSLMGTGLLEQMARFSEPMFSLIGGRDPSLKISRSRNYRAMPNLTHLEVAGMDHGWQHLDGDMAKRDGLEQAMTALADWL